MTHLRAVIVWLALGPAAAALAGQLPPSKLPRLPHPVIASPIHAPAAPTTAPTRDPRLPPQFGIDGDSFRVALSRTYWQWVASQPCRPAPWRPDLRSPAGFIASTVPLRAEFSARVGPLGGPPAGDSLQSIVLVRTPKYRVELVTFTGRLSPSIYQAYLIVPAGEGQFPTILLAHGAGTIPRQAVGWRFGGKEAIKYQDSPIERIGVNLAERGYAVLVPWIRDDYSNFWPPRPWISLDRSGTLYGVKRGGSGFGLGVSELESAVDYLQARNWVDISRVAAAGWEEGADLAAGLTALDPRVKVLVRLMPPLDRRRWRATAEGVEANPGFVQFDCTFAETELAALILPRPILYDWSADDPTFGRSRFFVDTTVTDVAESYYVTLGQGSGITLQHGRARGTARAQRVADWLDRVFERPRDRTVLSGKVPPLPFDPAATAAGEDSSIASQLGAIALAGSCPSSFLAAPPTSSLLGFLTAAGARREELRRQFRVPPPEGAPPRIIIRDTLERNADFTLEWIVTTPTARGLPLTGLLATPVGLGGPYPALLTFDGDFNGGEPFGLPPNGKTPYLKAYAREVARRGVIVFAPMIPAWFGEAGQSILAARDPQGVTMWGTVLGQVRAATDLLLAQPDLDSSRVTMQGISFAGFIALYGTALDTRITDLVYSNPINTADSLFADRVGGQLATWYSNICGTFNQVQQYLIAPRPFIWENGVHDDNGFERSPLEAARDVQHIYEALGIPERFHLLRHSGGHEEQPDLVRALDPYRKRSDR